MCFWVFSRSHENQLLQNFWFFGLDNTFLKFNFFAILSLKNTSSRNSITLWFWVWITQAHAIQLLCNKPNLLKQAIQIRLEIRIISYNYNYKGKPFVIIFYLIIYLFLIIILFHLNILIYYFHCYILFIHFNIFYQMILFQIIIFELIVISNSMLI